MLMTLQRAALLAIVIATGTATDALAQAPAPDPHHPEAAAAGTTTPADPGLPVEQIQDGQPAGPGTMGLGMMGDMMGQGLMGGGMRSGIMEPAPRMQGHMMRIMSAIADTDGDGGISFEEVSAIQRRIFDVVDADQDGRVTAGELQGFMQE